jgi:hypothetical protein
MYCIIPLALGLDVAIVTSFLNIRAPRNSARSYGWQGAATAYLSMAGQCYTCLKNMYSGGGTVSLTMLCWVDYHFNNPSVFGMNYCSQTFLV